VDGALQRVGLTGPR